MIVTSDHGEELWEHGGWRHGQTMYDEQLLVPLIVHLPGTLRRALAAVDGSPPSTIDDLVRLVDVYPTALDLLDVPLPHPVQGRSLRPLLAGQAMPALDALAENTNAGPEKKALRSRQFKFVHAFPRSRPPGDESGDTFELYDLERDPGERTDIAALRPDLVDALRARIDNIRHGREAGPLDEELPEEIPEELRERLRSLGYLGD